MFAKVVVDVRSLNVDIMYTYRIPDHLQEYVSVGSRVFVDFNVRKTLGYVVEISGYTDYAGTLKEILEVLDFEKELTEEQVQLALHISKETKSLLISSLELMYPSFLKTKFRKYLTIHNPDQMDAELSLLFGNRSKVLIDDELLKLFPKIKKEIQTGNVEISYDIYSYGKSKKVKEYRLHPNLILETLDLTPKRKKCFEFVESHPDCTLDDIVQYAKCHEEMVRDLVRREVFALKERYVVEEVQPLALYKTKTDYPFEQQEVLDKYHKLDKKPFLLYSNDDDFKLKFYLDVVFECIKAEKQVLVICPSILSSHAMMSYFEKNLSGVRIHHFSSATPHAEFYQDYMSVKTQNTDLVVATKVGAFMPLERLGLIIQINEENPNYLSEQTPKLRLKDALAFRSHFHKAKYVLSTSAPSMDSYYQHFTNRYYLLQYKKILKHQVRLVDFKQEVGISDLMITSVLKNEIGKAFNNRKIAMLILNQKAYSSSLMCQECSKVMMCTTCKVPLAYSKEKDQAKCPMCDYKKDYLVCDHCKSNAIHKMGYGLERLEEVLKELYPTARMFRVDADSFVNKKDYIQTLLAIDEQEVDILLGTTVLNDLVDKKDVGLVATIRADQILYSSDYRSAELVYQQIANTMCFDQAVQVIQGYHLNHYAIQTAVTDDFDTFFEKEWQYRQDLSYAPVCETSRLIITGEFKEMYHCANYFKKVFPKVVKGTHEVLGPVYLRRHRGVQLILKYDDFENTSLFIDEVSKKFAEQKIIIQFERHPRFFH